MNLLVWVVLQNRAGEILLGRRSGAGYGQHLWGLPGGKVEDGEALAAAAAREVQEEIGLTGLDLTLIGVRRYEVTDGARGVDFLFLGRNWQGEAQPLHKTSEVGWFDPTLPPPDLLPWIPVLLDLHLRRGAALTEQLGSPDTVSFVHGLHP